MLIKFICFFFFQAEDGIRVFCLSRGLGQKFKQGGIHHITVQLYAYKRHEILFEKDYEYVWKHMLDWISRQIITKNKSE